AQDAQDGPRRQRLSDHATGERSRNGLERDGIRTCMSLSMRALLAADPSLPEETRLGIARRDPGSTARLVELGLDECEAAELLDEPCPDEPCQA
ncbi:MAG: hypothetical protein ACRELB_11010, partial [Polyangiaceae bacterium]